MKLNGKLLIISLAALARILPHPANFAPIGGIALFGGAYMNKKEALLIPILAMVVSDIFIGIDSLQMRVAVYISFLIIVLIGFWIKDCKNIKNIVLASLLGSLVFFGITNFAVWIFGGSYPKTVTGLYECYLMAIPFFRNTILGDMFYTGVFFGGYELAIMSKWSKRLLFSS